MLNLKNNLIPIPNLWRQSILGEFDLLALALTLRGKPNGLKDYNDLNEVDCKGYYCGYFGLPSGQPPDALRMVAGHVPEARARSI